MAKQKKDAKVEDFAISVTRWVGSIQSIALHTVLFGASFAAVAFGVLPFDRMLLVLTTVVSLEAVYLAIFIQMSINIANATIEEVGQDIGEIQEDIDEIQEDVGEIQEDVDEIQEDVDELQEDVEEMTEEDKAEEAAQAGQDKTLLEIRAGLEKLMADIEKLQKQP